MFLGDRNSFAQVYLNSEALQDRSDLEFALESKTSDGGSCRQSMDDNPSYIDQTAHGNEYMYTSQKPALFLFLYTHFDPPPKSPHLVYRPYWPDCAWQ